MFCKRNFSSAGIHESVFPANFLIDIPHSLARTFRSHNLFEIKGLHSSVTIHTHYKTIAYAALLITENEKEAPYTRNEISLSFLCHRYPKKLLRHLTEDCKKTVAKASNGIYYVSEDTFPVQIILIRELSPTDALYLRCLTDRLDDARQFFHRGRYAYVLRRDFQIIWHQFQGIL